MNNFSFRFVFFLGALGATSALAVEKAPTRDELAFFEKNIRPVLVAKCYKST